MQLPIIKTTGQASQADLVRLYHRTELHWTRHLGEETQLDVGTAIVNPELAAVQDANCILDAAVPEDGNVDDAILEAEAHFASQGVQCAKWVLNPSVPAERTQLLADRLIASGFTTGSYDILHLAGQPVGRIQEIGGLTIIPARASFRHARQLADEWAAAYSVPQLADAAMLHLEDPHVDALLALKDGVAIAMVAVLSVGDMGCIEDLFVSEAHRRQGIGRTMMSRAMEICARSLFKQVFIGVDPSNDAAVRLYGEFGFKRVGNYVWYRRSQA